MNTNTTTAVLRAEMIDKGVWNVVDIESLEVVATFSGRAAARKFIAERKAVQDDVVTEVVDITEKPVVEKAEKVDPLKAISDKVIAKKAAGHYKGEKASKRIQNALNPKPKAAPKPKAEKAETVPTVDGWALAKHGMHLDVLRDSKGALPAGIVDAFKPRGAENVIGLYFTTAADFDTKQIGSTYVLRDSVTGRMVEVATKREGRERVAAEFGAKA